jgi:hypothetical protein
MVRISGEFSVDLSPLELSIDGKDGIKLARMSIVKTFHGDLSATSRGEMLSAMTGLEGSAGYIAIEQVEGSLSGKSGSFILQHFGTMEKGKERLILEVLPDSGTGNLAGLKGSMQIRVEDGQHHYDFEYQIDKS